MSVKKTVIVVVGSACVLLELLLTAHHYREFLPKWFVESDPQRLMVLLLAALLVWLVITSSEEKLEEDSGGSKPAEMNESASSATGNIVNVYQHPHPPVQPALIEKAKADEGKEPTKSISVKEAMILPPVDLRGDILEMFFYNPDKDFSVVTNEYVLLRVRITNHGPDEVAITGCYLEIVLKDFWQGAEHVAIPTNWRIKRRRADLVAIFDETVIEPALGVGVIDQIYKKGHPREGWLAFQLHLFKQVEYPNADFTLHLNDSLGWEHKVRREPSVYERTGSIAQVPIQSK